MSDERSSPERSPTAVESPASLDIEPAPVTYRWRSDGAVCDQCGTSTEKQWLDDGGFVCPDCKSWA